MLFRFMTKFLESAVYSGRPNFWSNRMRLKENKQNEDVVLICRMIYNSTFVYVTGRQQYKRFSWEPLHEASSSYKNL